MSFVRRGNTFFLVVLMRVHNRSCHVKIERLYSLDRAARESLAVTLVLLVSEGKENGFVSKDSAREHFEVVEFH